MKGIKVIFTVCLALLGFSNVWATENDDAARAATRRGATNTVTSIRQKSDTPDALTNTNANTRVTNATAKQNQTVRERATTSRTNTNISATSRTAGAPTVKQVTARTTANVSSRTPSKTQAPTNINISRAATQSRPAARTSTARYNPQRAAIARNATDTDTPPQNLRDTILNANAKECRNIYYSCMDEFCANKDSQLKRCACSSRLHEFDTVKKQLENAEEKMLDFSQRLLTVSMDAEDAAALNVATEGELAFNQKDTSKSKAILDEITNKLNAKFDDDSFDRNLTAISLSLNEDAAFDSVDSLMGASTTLKTGTALYSAALPVCREMAAEVCTPEQLSIAESGYQMMIEQDCNTVKKSYQTQVDAARTKVFENSALLDMSRLSTYQDKNSDDILTCKRKMLDMLSDTSVCGANLTKCLDMTGQYIDPATGEAFLTTNLANLSELITRPTKNSRWTDMPGNETFVLHLNSKKKFLEPAMEHCQDISDMVWNDFIEDALAQIKLAQDNKLEQVRQSCTTLTTQCLAKTAKSLQDFDSRALSTFGVIADKTVNEMCSDVKNACTALMEATGDTQSDWAGGMTAIAADTTYDTIIKTCQEVGRACIIQACKSVSSNFGLCENIDISINRSTIINRTACWSEVFECVKNAGNVAIDNIMNQLASRGIIFETTEASNNPAYSFYSRLYPNTTKIKDICESNCENANTHNCKTCRIAERIWGSCDKTNILTPTSDETTLLDWFAKNTGIESCKDNSCPDDEILYGGTCFAKENITNDNELCTNTNNRITIIDGETNGETNDETNSVTNCCSSGVKDDYGNCCESGTVLYIAQGNTTTEGYYNKELATTGVENYQAICVPSGTTNAVHVATYITAAATDTTAATTEILICLGTTSGDNIVTNYPNGQIIKCDGQYMTVDSNGIYSNPDTNDTKFTIKNYYKNGTSEYSYGENDWETVQNWKVSFRISGN